MTTVPTPVTEPTCAAALHRLGEHFAAGFMEAPEAAPVRRWSRAVRRRFEGRSLPPYDGERLYPAGPICCGTEDRILSSSYSFTWAFSAAALDECRDRADEDEVGALEALAAEMGQLSDELDVITTVHTVGGCGYTHSVPNYGRVLREGLDAYEERIGGCLARARQAGEAERIDLYEGLLDVVAGIRCWHGRLLAALREGGGLDADAADADAELRRQRLVTALERVPWQPPRSFFEAVVAYNLIYYLDDCDNPGRVDMELSSYYDADLQQGRATHEEAVALVRELWRNCDANSGWSAGIGGTDADGQPAFSELTTVCLEAARRMRRPNLQLHVRHDMPESVWDAALDTIASGCGLPALHHDEAFIGSLRDAKLGVREADLALHNGGGCTETMIHGLSNVGSLDAGLHLPLILYQTLEERLATAADFDGLLEAYRRDVVAAIDELTSQVNDHQRAKARLRPQPMRSLLIDDCIDTGREYNAGGARYNWSVINVAGLATVVDSLAAVREVVFETREIEAGALLEALRQDYEGQEPLRQRLAGCAHFGNDEAGVDALAGELAGFVFTQLLERPTWRGGRFLPSCLMFTTYALAGASVGATPDGRHAGEPIADSAGPHQGRDRRGPTAMLKSVASIPHHLAPGTLVVNARFTPRLFEGADRRGKLRSLVRTYFDLGGMQLQINVVDQKVLQDAVDHPERHQDLVVRVGGYSEYFHRLSPELQQTLLERTEHAA